MQATTGALVGVAAGTGYFAMVERDRTPAQKDCVYLMPASTDWLALLAGGVLIYTGLQRDNAFSTLIGSAISVTHVAKMMKKSKRTRRGRKT